jgi:broad specificity phosphatase PhoE
MASIFFVRHGQGRFGTDDYDRLSSLGLRQARLAGEQLRRLVGRVDHLLSGTLKRQRDTAAEIAECFGAVDRQPMEVRIDPRLDELDVDGQIEHVLPLLPDPRGELQRLAVLGRSSSREYQKLLKRVYLHWQTLSRLPSNIETWEAFSARVASILHEIMKDSRSGDVTVLVSSGGVIAAAVQRLLASPDVSAYSLFEAMMNGSITHLIHNRQHISVSSFNEYAYLLRDVSGSERELLTYR